jgi:predicted PurR-regulated permease PerM
MKSLNLAASALIVVLTFYLLIVGEQLLLPLVIAVAIWYLINTLASQFERVSLAGISLPRPACLIASIVTFIGLIVSLISFFSGRVNGVLDVAPVYQENLTQRLKSLPFMDEVEVSEQGMLELVTNWIDLPTYAASAAQSFAGILANGGLILIYVLFLFLEQGKFADKISALFAPSGNEEDAINIIDRIKDDIQKYISIKFFTSTLTGLFSYGALIVLDIDFPGVWALLIFLLNFIPTVGSIIATIFPAMIALAQADGYGLFLLVLGAIGAIQVVIGNILEPRMMGSRFNLSPIVILLNLALWGSIWGIVGMFLCVPLLIIVTIILSHFPKTRPIAIILSSDGRLRVPVEKTFQGFQFAPPESPLLGQAELESADD